MEAEIVSEPGAQPTTRGITRGWRRSLPRIMALLLAIGISVAIFALRDRVEQLASFGYPGVFLVSLLGNATLVLPVPGLVVIFAMGSALNPLLVGIVAGLGMALGEMTGYLAGYSGSAIVEDSAHYNQIERYVHRFGGWIIFLLALIPIPLFDVAGIAAGAIRFPVGWFLLAASAGKIVKATIVAFAGAGSLAVLESWLR
jgi:membrane protein YqaA with SNARE-associated domain